MMPRDLEVVSPSELVKIYERDAARHGEFTESGDYRKGNRCADRIAETYAELRRRGHEAQRELLALLLAA